MKQHSIMYNPQLRANSHMRFTFVQAERRDPPSDEL
jgi:hypothetical protein